jgi:hypothetical protein
MSNSDNMIKQYLNSQVNLNDIKTGTAKDDLSTVKTVNNAEEEANKAFEAFKEKLKVFDGITSIDKAKQIAKGFLPIENEKNYLKIGNAKCVIISRGDVFRVCVDSDKEYICYNIIKKAE